MFQLPKLGSEAIPLSHFPTKYQAFIFRAYEYVPPEKIAKILGTTAEKVREAARDMGLPEYAPGDKWLKRGYITIIRRMWHILPYDQLLELLDTDEKSLALIMREEDFLDIKLSDKPICERVSYRELSPSEREKTKKIKEIMSTLDFDGKAAFDFEYSVPKINFGGREIFETRMIYAFSGLYQHAFDVDSEEYLSDAQLKAYSNLGINGIWTQGVLSQLVRFPFDPSLSEGYEERIARVKALTERLDKYGIKLYLYLNEPRSMPLGFFEKYPEILGHVVGDNGCLCTSTDAVRDYLRDSIETICRKAPLIGGFFTITRSENMTNCYSHSNNQNKPCNCPRCGLRSVGEVISDTVRCFLEGARRVSRDIKIFAWSWRWDQFNAEIIDQLPKEVILISQSELDMPFDIGGVKGRVLDYSMSIVGPGERAEKEWRIAKERGLQIGAKVQVNTTWEASTVPAIPVSYSVEEHMRKLSEDGVKHLLLSWTLGGYPSKNLSVAAKYFYEKCDLEEESQAANEAERIFSEAFSEFPFHIGVLYNGPQNGGPSNLLFEEPTGYKATMTCFAYDDLETWRSIYPVEIFEGQFSRLCQRWEDGLNLLSKEDTEEWIMAEAAYCLFKSSLNQIRFIRARDDGRYADAALYAEEEIRTAKKMLTLMNKNPAIGYEAANHYYFSKGQIAEKILNCHYIAEKFKH